MQLCDIVVIINHIISALALIFWVIQEKVLKILSLKFFIHKLESVLFVLRTSQGFGKYQKWLYFQVLGVSYK